MEEHTLNLGQFDKFLLQIFRLLLRSQETGVRIHISRKEGVGRKEPTEIIDNLSSIIDFIFSNRRSIINKYFKSHLFA